MTSSSNRPAISRSTFVRVVLLVGVLPIVIAAIGILVLLAVTPEVIVTGWDINGEPRGTSDVWSLVAMIATLVPLFTAAMLVAAVFSLRHSTSRLYLQSLIAISNGFAALITGIAVGMSVVQIGVEDVTTLPGSVIVWPLIGSFAFAILIGFVTLLFTPPIPLSTSLSATPRSMELGPNEVAYWSGRSVSSKSVIAIPVVLTIGVLGLFAVIGIPLWGSLLFLVFMISVSSMLAWHVVVDRRGLKVTGLFGYPTFVFPIETVVAAAAVDIDPFKEFGGWGIRVGFRGRWGVIVRTGSAIEVERVNKSPFVVTVDDAETGAALLTALARR